MADMMKAMGGAKRGPMAGLAQMMGFGGGMPSPEEMQKLAEKMPGGLPPGMPGAPQGMPAKMPGPAAEFPRNAAGPWVRKCPASAAFRDLEKRNSEISKTRKETAMSLKIRLARAGTKKRPVYHIVIADSRSPARRPLHRAARLLQSAAAEGQQGSPQARPREGQGLDGEGRAADRPRVALPRRRRHAEARDAQQSREGEAEEEGAGARSRRGRRCRLQLQPGRSAAAARRRRAEPPRASR